MGMDIHMDILYKNKIIKEDIFPGRNIEWFLLLQGKYTSKEEYQYLPTHKGFFPPNGDVPENYKECYLDSKDYFGHRYIKVKDYMNWCIDYKPAINAGWVHRIDAWKYENKNILPEDVYKYLPQDAIVDDWQFIEFFDTYDSSHWLYNYIVEHDISMDAYILYCFDN